MTYPDMTADYGRVPPPPPDARIARNELLDKLNETLRRRADEMVDRALEPVLHQASAPITKALNTIIGGNNRAALAAVELRVADAITEIARDVKEHAYQALVHRAIHHLSTGQDFFLD